MKKTIKEIKVLFWEVLNNELSIYEQLDITNISISVDSSTLQLTIKGNQYNDGMNTAFLEAFEHIRLLTENRITFIMHAPCCYNIDEYSAIFSRDFEITEE